MRRFVKLSLTNSTHCDAVGHRRMKYLQFTFKVWYGSHKVSYSKQSRGKSTNANRQDLVPVVKHPIPAFDNTVELSGYTLRQLIPEAVRAWLRKTPSHRTRVNYSRDLDQFLNFAGIDAQQLESLVAIRPEHVAAWRDEMKQRGNANATIRRKMTALRALFSYLQVYGYVGANPAHGKFGTRVTDCCANPFACLLNSGIR